MNDVQVTVYHVSGRQARKLFFRDIKENRRRRLLLRLIRERRAQRAALRSQD